MATHKIILYAKSWYPEIPAPGKGRKNTARQKLSVLLGPKKKKNSKPNYGKWGMQILVEKQE